MPILTTLLLLESNISLEENMEKFKQMIKLDSITQEELYVKNSMQSRDLHTKAVEIIQEAMMKIINHESPES